MKEAPAPFMEAVGSPETWKLEYADVDWDELVHESRQITRYITKEARDELKLRQELGIFELIPTEDGRHRVDSAFTDSFFEGLAVIVVSPDKVFRRYEVGEEGFPELYALARKARWLGDEALRRRRYPRGVLGTAVAR